MSQSLTKTNAPNQVDCLLIPLKDKNLLLPNVSVAEIIPFSHLLTTASSADWILGRIDWRGTPVPVVCYEMLNRQSTPAPNPDARFAVVNGVGNHREMPFYAILIQGIPRLVHLAENDIQEVEAMNAGEYDITAVSLEGGQAMIPDLEHIESTLLGYI